MTAPPPSLYLPDGTFTYDAHPWLTVVDHVAGTLIICATVIWALHVLRKPLSEFIARVIEADTPFGKYSAPPLQRPVGDLDLAKPPASTAPEDESEIVKAWRNAFVHQVMTLAKESVPSSQLELIAAEASGDAVGWATSWSFERLYNTLYGSQLHALLDMYRSHVPFMYGALSRYFNVSRNAGFVGTEADWILPLLNSNLVRKIDFKGDYASGYEITPTGRAFVEYVRDQGLEFNKSF